MTLSIEEYLFTDAAINVLCELDPEGSRLVELDERCPTSRSTITEKLKQGQKLGLLEQYAITGSEGRLGWRFTPKGATLRLVLEDTGAKGAYQDWKSAKARYKKHVEQARRRMFENIEGLENDAANASSLDRLLDRYEQAEEPDRDE
jgi:DNA-binding HxlR family transcriptional regulator